jgi:hypothetical protein
VALPSVPCILGSRRIAIGGGFLMTPFPTRPADVVALSIGEFTFDHDKITSPSLDAACRRFVGDANRALVWLIRSRALKAWIDGPDMAEWLTTGSRSARDACEVAAAFELNDRWEFDTADFCLAVDALISRRSGGRWKWVGLRAGV